MATRERLKGMKLAQLRKLAAEWPSQEIGQLSREDLIGYIAQALKLESMSIRELRSQARQQQVRRAGQMGRTELVLYLLRAGRFEAKTLADLRSLASDWGIEGVGSLKKQELIQQLLQAEVWRVPPPVPRPAPARALKSFLKHLRERLAATHWRRWLGATIQVTSVLGALVGLVCLIAFPFLAARGSTQAQTILVAASDVGRASADSLELAADSLGQASAVLEDASVTIGAVEDSLASAEPLLDSVGDLVGDTAPATLDTARQALLSAESSAAAIDRTLRILASFELLFGVTYAPSQPLDRSLADVAASLEPLPAALDEVRGSLDTAVENLAPVRASLQVVADDLILFSEDLTALQAEVYGHSDSLDDLTVNIERMAGRVPSCVLTLTILVELILIGFVVEQGAVFVVGRQLRTASERVVENQLKGR